MSDKPVRTPQPWKKIHHRLSAAHDRLAEALALIEQEPNTGHISGNLEPVVESVKRFRDLAADKMKEVQHG